jgi:hypothetical protein
VSQKLKIIQQAGKAGIQNYNLNFAVSTTVRPPLSAENFRRLTFSSHLMAVFHGV